MRVLLQVNALGMAPSPFDHPGPVARIGRNPDGDLIFPEGPSSLGVSWNHAKVELTPGGAFLADLNSTNGTFLNGEKVKGRVPLKVGDQIRLGNNGPQMRVEALELTTPAKQFPFPAPAADGPPADGGTTRKMLVTMHSQNRRLLVGLAAAGVLAALLGALALYLLGGRVQQAQADAEEQARKIQSQVAELSKADVADIEKHNVEAVYLFGAQKPDGRIIPAGTAFAIDAAGKFATNSHVASLIPKIREKGLEPTLFSPGCTRRFTITDYKLHPKYKVTESRSIDRNAPMAPDVAVLKVDLKGTTLPQVVQLGGPDDFKELRPGCQLCFIGYPVWDPATDYTAAAKVVPRVQPGRLNRLLTLERQQGDAAQQQLLEHDMQSLGGASGSPIFNHRGRVVALHFAGLMITLDGGVEIPQGPKWGVRVDLLQEMLKP